MDPHSIFEHQLDDRHRIVRELGSGGMATVYLARDTKHNRDVAVKVLRPEVADAVGAERFLREIDTVARLNHPHVLPLHDSGTAGELLWFSMPHVEGESLRERLDREGRLPVADAIRIGRECADGLAYAHDQGVLHRDIKPANVLLSDGHAVLSDFGIAGAVRGAALEPETGPQVGMGTVGYMSPEQALGDSPVDARSEVYALGCVLYEMVTGEPPFAGRSSVAIVARQIADPPRPVRELRPDVPPELAGIVERCLAVSPDDRFPSVAELRDALAEAGAVPTGLRALASRPWAVGAAGAVVVALVVAALMLPLGGSPDPPVDPHRVVVFPLADRGGGEEAGADVALMIGNALVHTDPLTWIDGWERLTPEQRRDVSLLSPDATRAIALDRQAGFYLTGGVVRTRDSVALRIVLHETVGDSVVAQASAAGAVGERTAGQLGLRAVIDLLPHLVEPGRDVDLAMLTDRDPSAVARWLQGDRAYRGARFDEALELYRDAVERDPALALAAIKGAQAASWTERLGTADGLIRQAVAHDSVLPPRYRELAAGFRAYLDGEADEAVRRFRAALAADPEWSEAWMALAEVYRHLLPSDMVPGVSDREAFRAAARYDPGFRPPYIHLADAALRAGDLVAADTLVRRLDAAPPTGMTRAVRLAWRCAAGRLEEGEWAAQARQGPLDVVSAAKLLADGPPGQAACAESGFRAVLEEEHEQSTRWAAVMGLNALLAAHGREEDAIVLLDAARAQGLTGAMFLYLLDAVAEAGPAMVPRAVGVDSLARSIWGDDFAELGTPLNLWALSGWNLQRGNADRVAAVRDRFRALGLEDGPDRDRVLARAVEAHHRAVTGDTAGAIALLRGLESPGGRSSLTWGLAEPLALERLLLAQLLLESGDPAGAWDVAALLDHPAPAMFALFRPLSLSIRARAAERLDGPVWQERARDARARLEALGREDLLTPSPLHPLQGAADDSPETLAVDDRPPAGDPPGGVRLRRTG